jgi:hypothetical protein
MKAIVNAANQKINRWIGVEWMTSNNNQVELHECEELRNGDDVPLVRIRTHSQPGIRIDEDCVNNFKLPVSLYDALTEIDGILHLNESV